MKRREHRTPIFEGPALADPVSGIINKAIKIWLMEQWRKSDYVLAGIHMNPSSFSLSQKVRSRNVARFNASPTKYNDT